VSLSGPDLWRGNWGGGKEAIGLARSWNQRKKKRHSLWSRKQSFLSKTKRQIHVLRGGLRGGSRGLRAAEARGWKGRCSEPRETNSRTTTCFSRVEQKKETSTHAKKDQVRRSSKGGRVQGGRKEAKDLETIRSKKLIVRISAGRNLWLKTATGDLVEGRQVLP